MLFSSLRKRIKRWERKLTLSKRQQFVAVTMMLTAGLLFTQIVPSDWRYPMVVSLSLAAYLGSAFGLREELTGVEWFTLLTLPTLFTAAVALFYFLLPVRWLTRVPVVIFYAVGMYALLLTENIYNVAADRSIALLRAAHSVGFLLTLITYFLLVSTVLAFRFPLPIGAFLVAVVSFFLIGQSLWAILLEEGVSRRIWQITGALAAILFELTWVFGFWPIKSILIALFLTTCFYSTVGMAQQYLVEKLYKKTVIEFFSVSVIVLVILMFATRWRGNF